MDLRSSDEAIRRDIPSFIEPRPPLIHHPFMRPRPEKRTNLLGMFEEEDSDVEEPELVQVYLRMKPCKVPSNLYELRSDKCLVTSLDTTTAGHGRRTQHNVPKMYIFSRIFKPECNQKEIFEEVVKGNLKKLVDGHSFTLLTYGASGSGKTYTIMGTVNSPGLVPRSLEYLFKLIEAARTPDLKPSDTGINHLGRAQQDSELQWVKRLLQAYAPFREKYRRMSAQLCSDLTDGNFDLTNRAKYYVWVSFVEIYNDTIYDLLAPPDKREKLRLREDSTGNVYVKGVTQAFVRSGEEAYDVLVAGKHNLVVAATGIHAHSSRSHCIFTITLLTERDGEIRTSQVRLCDLAGAERQRAACNTGARMKESRAINSSLHVLERCLHVLRRKQRSGEAACVPYRESKLTRLLGAGLSGARGEAVSMVVTLNPAPQYAHETKHVLALAAVARDIHVNNTMDPGVTTISSLENTQDTTVQEYAEEILRLRTENERLHFELLQAESCVNQLRSSMKDEQQKNAATMQALVQDTRDMMREFYERQLHNLTEQMKDMENDYEKRLDELHNELRIMRELVPQEKLTNRSSVMSKEMQREMKYIEDQDETEYQERESESPVPESSSESESDADLDESLEPVNHIRKSILQREKSLRHEAVIDLINESSEGESEYDETEHNKSEHGEFGNSIAEEAAAEKLLVRNEEAISKDSLYATGDEISETESQSKIDNELESCANVISLANEMKPNDSTTEVETNTNVTINAEKDRSDYEELFNVSTKLDETEDVVGTDSVAKSLRGTFCVRNKLQNEIDDEQKVKNLNMLRGTYFVAEREESFYKETNIESDSLTNLKNKEIPTQDNKTKKNGNESPKENVQVFVENKELLVHEKDSAEKSSEFDKNTKSMKPIKDSFTESIKPKQAPETLVSKIIKSFKTRQSSESSLQQFEQLEMAVSNADNTTDAVKSFEISIPSHVLKGKKYFDDTAKQISPTTKHENPEKACESTEHNNKLKYFEDEPGTSNFGQMSNAAVAQEKRLLFDSPISTIPEEKDSTAETDMKSIILTPRIVKKAQLFYSEHDKIHATDTVISRSPSIVRDEIPHEYEPSIAMKKILGESFTKPEILSSARKERLATKKHDSVDLFESPFSTKANSKEIIENTNAAKPMDNLNNEILSVTNLKEKANEIAVKFIESLVASQQIKDYVKRDKDSKETYSDSKDSLTNDRKNDTLVKEIKQEDITLERTTFTEISTTDKVIAKETKETITTHKTKVNKASTKETETTSEVYESEAKSSVPLNETVTSKGNNTVDEFENIVKNLTNVRATDFDLLVAEEDLIAGNKPNEQDKKDPPKEKSEMTERKKKLAEEVIIIENKQIKQEIEDPPKEKSETTERRKKLAEKVIITEDKVIKQEKEDPPKEKNEMTERRKKFEEAKYNLRNKEKSTNSKLSDERKDQDTEILKPKSTKRSLRLRRNKNVEQDSLEQDKEKLKDIMNLREEFSDVTLGVPAVKKLVKDIPSPEKKVEEEENVPPLGIQSCPSKSVSRSRRKLFTPRAEPLEESLSQAADSNERVQVLRPSYHKGRARRRLN